MVEDVAVVVAVIVDLAVVEVVDVVAVAGVSHVEVIEVSVDEAEDFRRVAISQLARRQLLTIRCRRA